jgi:hypothetical protein
MHEIRAVSTEINVETWGSNAMHMLVSRKNRAYIFSVF